MGGQLEKALMVSLAAGVAVGMLAVYPLGFTAAIAWPDWLTDYARESGRIPMIVFFWDLLVVEGLALAPLALVGGALIGKAVDVHPLRWGFLGAAIAWLVGAGWHLFLEGHPRMPDRPWWYQPHEIVLMVTMPLASWFVWRLRRRRT